jgi:hypothetical protein
VKEEGHVSHADEVYDKLLLLVRTGAETGFLIVDSNTPSQAYVQFQGGSLEKGDSLRWEAVSNEFLKSEYKLGPDEIAYLERLGFDCDNEVNYGRDVLAPLTDSEVRGIAETSALLLHEVYRVPRDAHLAITLELDG